MASKNFTDVPNIALSKGTLDGIINKSVLPSFIQWEKEVAISTQKSSKEESQESLEQVLHKMSKKVSHILKSELTYQGERSSRHDYSKTPRPEKIAEDMAKYLKDWKEQFKSIKKTYDATKKRQGLTTLLLSMQGRIELWMKRPNDTQQRQRSPAIDYNDDRDWPHNTSASLYHVDLQNTKEELLDRIHGLERELSRKDEARRQQQPDTRENVVDLRNEIKELKRELERQKEEHMEILSDQKSKLRNQIERERETHNDQYNEARRQREEAMTRLSEIAGNKLRQNNPNITDLSSANRPTKIAERLKELYTNEWTNAFEHLSKECDEKNAIYTLLVILQDSYEFTADVSKRQLNQLEHSAQMLTFSDEKHRNSADRMKPASDPKYGETANKPIELSEECLDLTKQLLKASSTYFVPMIQERFVIQQNAKMSDIKASDKMIEYCNACAEITWHMNVQTPPMVFKENPATGEPVTDQYAMYTISGEEVDYVVWPACLLHKRGPLLAKGVLQPKRRGNRRK